MKNILALLILVLLSASHCWSQSKGALHLSLGSALPIGKFASKDLNNDPESGTANLGGLAELGYSYPLEKSNWGLTIGFSGRLNAIDNKTNEEYFRESFQTYTWSATKSHYKSLALMGGVYYNWHACSKMDIRIAVSVGAANCYIPDYTVTGIMDTAHTGATSYIQARQLKAHSTTFSAMAKTGVVYHLNRRIQLLANLDFWYLHPYFSQITATLMKVDNLVIPGLLSPSNAGTAISYNSYTHSYTQPMNSLDLTVGLGFTL